MLRWIGRYVSWLHTRWPAGTVEKLPLANEDGSTNVSGLYLVGDLTGVPLLKFSSDSGARVVDTIRADPAFKGRRQDDADVLDVVVVGAGVSGVAAIAAARAAGLRAELIEASLPFSTIVNFPRAKPIYTYPTEMTPAGALQFGPRSDVKEGLLEELREFLRDHDITPRIAHVERIVRRGPVLELELDGGGSVKAHRVIIGIGRSGNYRRLGIPGEDRDLVSSRLHDPRDFCGKDIVIVGGGDSALETAIALGSCGSTVTLSYRKAEFSRPKPDNIEKINALVAQGDADVGVEHPTSELVTTSTGPFIPDRATDDACEGCGGSLRGYPKDGECPGCGKPYHRRLGALRLMMASRPKEIRQDSVIITNAAGEDETIPAEAVFIMIGREAPLDFFRRSGVHVRGDWRARSYINFALILLAFIFLYHWKKPGVWLPIGDWFKTNEWFPYSVPAWWAALGSAFERPSNILGTLGVSVGEPGFYYSVAYCTAMLLFGIRRIRRRRTPYVTVQTITLVTIQFIPLFLLPYILLPLMGHNGWFDSGFGAWFANEFFPAATYTEHGREYWRAFGFILAWPLFIWNVFSHAPLWGWLLVSLVQTFVIIPLIVHRWGKGAYCSWICSCGGMAETMGDAHRQKMPHGPGWNRLNMIGQVILAIAFLLLITRSISWAWPASGVGAVYHAALEGIPVFNYVWAVDLLFAGIIGFGFYWHFSGRVWCRFGCPLAALMHIYARFSQFRILADKKKCISCNQCTTVCHQGIDVMSFANKGLPMEDPECVRCSACVQTCPTGVLQFGRVDRRTGDVLGVDRLAASPVLMAEMTVNGKRV